MNSFSDRLVALERALSPRAATTSTSANAGEGLEGGCGGAGAGVGEGDGNCEDLAAGAAGLRGGGGGEEGGECCCAGPARRSGLGGEEGTLSPMGGIVGGDGEVSSSGNSASADVARAVASSAPPAAGVFGRTGGQAESQRMKKRLLKQV
jgi:hypothetical protein